MLTIDVFTAARLPSRPGCGSRNQKGRTPGASSSTPWCSGLIRRSCCSVLWGVYIMSAWRIKGGQAQGSGALSSVRPQLRTAPPQNRDTTHAEQNEHEHQDGPAHRRRRGFTVRICGAGWVCTVGEGVSRPSIIVHAVGTLPGLGCRTIGESAFAARGSKIELDRGPERRSAKAARADRARRARDPNRVPAAFFAAGRPGRPCDRKNRKDRSRHDYHVPRLHGRLRSP
jgi:hypothetical protein